MSDIGRVIVNDTKNLVNNIISGEKLRNIQQKVLRDLKDSIIKSMGPAGSNALILRGNDDATIVSEYSKDGNKIIKSIKYSYPIEMSIKAEIENSTRYIEKTVGDGTSSIVVMSSLIFDSFLNAENEDPEFAKNPYQTIRTFKKVVGIISDKIRELGHEATLDDIYNIALISTNGNEDVASQLKDIYKDYGMNVFIDVSASTNENTYVKTYDGVTIEAGYADPCMINSVENGNCTIRSTSENPVHVYHFAEPIDTPEQLKYYQQIIETNVVARLQQRVSVIPTVILVPQISRDAQAYMRRINNIMNQFGEEAYSQKPQLLVITNYMGLDENYVDHISTLCGCKPIKKYIDDKIQEQDQKAGLAPTLQTVCDFYGTTGEVVSDSLSSKFIDPSKMYDRNADGTAVLDENGDPVLSKTYNNIVNFLQAEYKSNSEQGGNAGVLGSLKRQLNAIKSNMVELFIGGISISDRDSLRDLVEDAVLNTRSAAKNGVGYGANVNGLVVIDDILNNHASEYTEDEIKIFNIIKNAYYDEIVALYETTMSHDEAVNITDTIVNTDGIPYNISTGKYDGLVLTSIESEPMILDTISKIISIMETSNQVILQAPQLAMHY